MQTRPRQTFLGTAGPHDLEAIQLLLTAASLPYADVTERSLDHFFVARSGGRIVGCVGFERYQHVALLRSLVVAPEVSHGGSGGQLVAAAEERIAAMSIAAVYLFLLTTTAAPFFERLGYRQSPRDLAPMAITTSAQFESLCPASAQLMVKP